MEGINRICDRDSVSRPVRIHYATTGIKGIGTRPPFTNSNEATANSNEETANSNEETKFCNLRKIAKSNEVSLLLFFV